MKSKLDSIFIVMGCGCIAAALVLFLHNQIEQDRAAAASQEAIVKVVEAIQERQQINAEQEIFGESDDSLVPPDLEVLMNPPVPETPVEVAEEPEFPLPPAETISTVSEEFEMEVVAIDGYDYIGFLSIPSLGLELPVMGDWTYEQLQLSPCRYSGSVEADDLVIMAHNYAKHFANLKNVRTGDAITFTDMCGNITDYEVAALDILGAGAVEEMTSGEYALSLFTCNYSGDKRITVRCDRVKN